MLVVDISVCGAGPPWAIMVVIPRPEKDVAPPAKAPPAVVNPPLPITALYVTDGSTSIMEMPVAPAWPALGFVNAGETPELDPPPVIIISARVTPAGNVTGVVVVTMICTMPSSCSAGCGIPSLGYISTPRHVRMQSRRSARSATHTAGASEANSHRYRSA